MNNFLVLVPVIFPSQPLQFSDGFISFLLIGLFFFSIFAFIESIIIFIRRL